MDNLKNYIFYSICQKSYEYFKTSNFSTFRNFSKGVCEQMSEGKLSPSSMGLFVFLIKDVGLMYDLSKECCVDYIAEYYDTKQYLEFDESMRRLGKAFQSSII